MKRRCVLAIGVGSIALAVCSAADKAPAKPSGDPAVGRWRRPQKPTPGDRKVMVIKAGGSCYYYYPGKGKVTGKWSVLDAANHKYKVVWAGGAAEYEFRIGTDGRMRDMHGGIVYERAPEE